MTDKIRSVIQQSGNGYKPNCNHATVRVNIPKQKEHRTEVNLSRIGLSR